MQLEGAVGDGEMPESKHHRAPRSGPGGAASAGHRAGHRGLRGLRLRHRAPGHRGGFWGFCDHYLEMVKSRSYVEEDSPGRRSAVATLSLGSAGLPPSPRALRPVRDRGGLVVAVCATADRPSVHTTPRGRAVVEVVAVPRPDHAGTYAAAVEVLAAIRGTKTKAQKSLRWPVGKLEIVGPRPRPRCARAGSRGCTSRRQRGRRCG